MLEEDYFFGEDKDKSNTKVFALVIYDICDNKQRLKREMKTFCTSVDSIRIYRINGKSEVIHFGIDLSRDIDDVILI